jgi:hypothetical protein
VLEYRNRYADGSHSSGEGNQGAPLAGVSALCFQFFCIIGPVSCVGVGNRFPNSLCKLEAREMPCI